MSIHQFPGQFERDVTPLAPSEQKVMELWLKLAMSLHLPPKIRHGGPANDFDLELAKQRIETVIDVTLEYLDDAVGTLNENLPITQTLDLDYLRGPLVDLRSEIGGMIEKRMGE
jgi:hypothetical protein